MKGKGLIAILLMGVLNVSCVWVWQAWPDQYFHVVFCDVGQGDAILIKHGFTQILVDGGPDDAVLRCLDEHMPFWDKTMELVISTHPDADHLAGIVPVLQHYRVQELWLQARVKDTKLFWQFYTQFQLALKKGTVARFVKAGDQQRFDSLLSLLVVYPREKTGDPLAFKSSLTETQLSAVEKVQTQQYGSANDGCIAILLKLGKVNVFLPADLEAKGELALLESGVIPQIQVLKAAHHGSKTSSTIKFVRKIRPEEVVISVGTNNRYGHPHSQTLKTFTELGTQIFRTDELGDIEVVSDGERYWHHARSNKKMK